MRQKKKISVALKIPTGLSKDLLPIADEIDRLHESVLWSAQGQLEQTKLWRLLNLLFGVPAAALAAIAGGTGLAATEVTQVPGILALIAAGFGAALTTLNPSRRVSQAQASGNAYLELQTEARQFLLVRLPGLTRDEALEQLTALTERRNDVNKTADPPNKLAYWRARRNITKTGGQSYEADEKKKP